MNARALLLGAALALAGCVTAPKEAPHETAITAPTLGLAGAPLPATNPDWWKSFKDPQLDALIAQVLRVNPTLAESVARLRGAEVQAQGATAASRPGFTFDGQEQREHFAEHFIYPPPFAGGDYWTGQVGLNLDWDLDFWGRQAALIEQLKDKAQAATFDAAAARLAIAGALAQGYIGLYRADVLACIAAQSEQQRAAILDIAHQRVAAGLDTEVELREAEAALPQARTAEIQAQAAAELAKHQLAALAGEGTDAYVKLQSPKLDLDAALILPQQLPADLLAHRPDVLAAKSRVDGATAGRTAAHQAFYPDVNLSAFAGLTAIGLGNLFRGDDGVYGAGPAIHLPLFDSIRLKSAYRQSTADLDAAIDSYNATVLHAVQQAADALSLIGFDGQQVEQNRARLAATQAAFDLAQNRYKAGLSDYLTVLNAETQLLDARREQVDVLAALATSRVALLLALGGSFDAASANLAAASPATPIGTQSHE